MSENQRVRFVLLRVVLAALVIVFGVAVYWSVKSPTTAPASVATPTEPSVPQASVAQPIVSEQQEPQAVEVDLKKRTVTAKVLSHVDDAPTTTVYRMDLGSVGMEEAPQGFRVGCVGRVMLRGNQLQDGHFQKGSCRLPDLGTNMTFYFVAGTRVLVNIDDSQWASANPEFVDLWQTDLPVASSIMQEGSIGGGAPLTPPWRELVYRVDGSGSVGAGWSVIDSTSGDLLGLSCTGFVIPRTGKAPIVIENYCPDLDANVSLPGLRVGVMRLTTNDNRTYEFGVENNAEDRDWPHFEYVRQ